MLSSGRSPSVTLSYESWTSTTASRGDLASPVSAGSSGTLRPLPPFGFSGSRGLRPSSEALSPVSVPLPPSEALIQLKMGGGRQLNRADAARSSPQIARRTLRGNVPTVAVRLSRCCPPPGPGYSPGPGLLSRADSPVAMRKSKVSTMLSQGWFATFTQWARAERLGQPGSIG